MNSSILDIAELKLYTIFEINGSIHDLDSALVLWIWKFSTRIDSEILTYMFVSDTNRAVPLVLSLSAYLIILLSFTVTYLVFHVQLNLVEILI